MAGSAHTAKMNRQTIVNTTKAIRQLCLMMQETDASEFCIEVGLNGGGADGARYLIHIIKQCPEAAVEDEEEE